MLPGGPEPFAGDIATQFTFIEEEVLPHLFEAYAHRAAMTTQRQDGVGLGLDEFVTRFQPERVLALPATDLARKHLGRPLPNAALLGGFSALTGEVGLKALAVAIGEKFPGETGARNIAAARAAFGLARREARVHA